MPSFGAPVGNPWGLAPGQHIRLLDAFIEAQEAEMEALEDANGTGTAMSTSDFPTYMTQLIRHTFLERFAEVTGQWAQYTRDFSLDDFEEHTSSRWGRFPDIEEKPLQGPYNRIYLKELPAEKMKLREWGNAWDVTRKLIISDRLNKISETPQLAADALARTQSKVAAVDSLQSNPTMYDGNALFSSAHANIGAATALTATVAGAALLQALELLIALQKDDEGYKVVPPGGKYTIIHPTEMRWVINALLNSELLPNASNFLEVNPIRGRYNAIEEPFFTDANNYYMFADLKGPLGPIAAITLNGNTVPFIGLLNPQVRGIQGGTDPYTFEFDDLSYKIRHDFNFKPVEWRGAAAALPA